MEINPDSIWALWGQIFVRALASMGLESSCSGLRGASSCWLWRGQGHSEPWTSRETQEETLGALECWDGVGERSSEPRRVEILSSFSHYTPVWIAFVM